MSPREAIAARRHFAAIALFVSPARAQSSASGPIEIPAVRTMKASIHPAPLRPAGEIERDACSPSAGGREPEAYRRMKRERRTAMFAGRGADMPGESEAREEGNQAEGLIP
jgi:hypothetical protein